MKNLDFFSFRVIYVQHLTNFIVLGHRGHEVTALNVKEYILGKFQSPSSFQIRKDIIQSYQISCDLQAMHFNLFVLFSPFILYTTLLLQGFQYFIYPADFCFTTQIFGVYINLGNEPNSNFDHNKKTRGILWSSYEIHNFFFQFYCNIACSNGLFVCLCLCVCLCKVCL